MQNDRDKLIELLCKAPLGFKTFENQYGKSTIYNFADYLLANGVIVPPCKVGDSIFRVGNGKIWEWLIEHIEIYGDEIGFVDDGENYFTPDKIGKTVFLTKEEAEAELQKRDVSNA